MHCVAAVGQRHPALAQGAHFIAHIAVARVTEAFEQAADRGFRYAAKPRQFGAVIAHQVVNTGKNKVGHPLFLRRQFCVMVTQTLINLFHLWPFCNQCFSKSAEHTMHYACQCKRN
ncbi:hypothetical protein SRABI106_04112 [Rahnella aquatilis]|nr:hypothetical protein SRABI106_04112 [Rahnella aquatilis]